MNDYNNPIAPPKPDSDSNRLEIVTACVGFDDILDITLANNLPEVDIAIVVTTHEDRKTQQVARKHGAILVITDLFFKNGRHFNKGAALNAGFGHFQYRGWRAVIDADIAFPRNFRRMLLNHTHLNSDSIYGIDRVDLVGKEEISTLSGKKQHVDSYAVSADHFRPTSHRYVDPLYGYVPIGYFQLWNAKNQKSYPYSLGSAAHDDVLFATQWPASHRHLLQTSFVYHLCPEMPRIGQNWDGRKSKRLDA